MTRATIVHADFTLGVEDLPASTSTHLPIRNQITGTNIALKASKDDSLVGK